MKKRTDKFLIILYISFLIAFPKGGFKVGPIPITWGYLLLIFAFLISLLSFMFNSQNVRLNKNKLIALSLIVPLQLYLILSFLYTGVGNMGFAFSLVFNFIFIPWLFLFFLDDYINKIDMAFLLKVIKNAVLFTAVYGIVLFIYKLKTGQFIEIPYLTINQGDSGELENKYIDRGGIFKLISTYNNGNIYGVSLLILLPLYFHLEKRKIGKILLVVAMVLTLSRTVWIGLIIYQIMNIRLTAKSLAAFVFVGLFFMVAIVWVLNFLSFDLDFLFDKNLGGRIEQFDVHESITIISSIEFSEIKEIIYLSILYTFGIVGLLLFLMALFSPVAMYFIGFVKDKKSSYKKSLCQGLIIYLIVACSDGALLYIPVMGFFWLVATLLLSKHYEVPEQKKLAVAS